MSSRALLERRDDRLMFDGADLESLASVYGTPLHVFSRQALRASVERFGAAFATTGRPIDLHFSVKTNSVPAVLRAMDDEGVGLEVISPYEDWLARRCGFSGESLIVTGAHFQQEEWPRLAEDPPLFWSIESTHQLRTLLDGLIDLPQPLPVALRICPGLKAAPWSLSESSGASGAPYGFELSSPTFDEALSALIASPKVELIGMHLHIGSGIASAKPYRKAFKALRVAIGRAAQAGARITTVDIGGGFGHAPAPLRAPLEMLGIGRHAADAEDLERDEATAAQAALLTSVAESLAELDESLRRDRLGPERYIAEPGRALVADSQLTLLSVRDIIERSDSFRQVICDGGAMSLSPMLYVEQHRLLAARRRPGEGGRCLVLGSLPSALDHVARGVWLPPLDVGDVLALCDTGAYFNSFENHFAGPRPAIVAVDQGRVELARRRERFEEVIARDEAIENAGDGDEEVEAP